MDLSKQTCGYNNSQSLGNLNDNKLSAATAGHFNGVVNSLNDIKGHSNEGPLIKPDDSSTLTLVPQSADGYKPYNTRGDRHATSTTASSTPNLNTKLQVTNQHSVPNQARAKLNDIQGVTFETRAHSFSGDDN